MTPIRLVLADDQAMIRAGLALVLGSEPDIEVVAQFYGGRELLQAIGGLAPDLVLTDIRMPGLDGIDTTREIKALPAGPPVLILTTFDDDDVLWPALDVGADGFILKDSPADSLIQAVRTIAAGGAWLDPRVLPRVIDRAKRSPSRIGSGTGVLTPLTPRERQVLDLLCVGANNVEIAGRLHTTERTTKAHVSAILQKLGARDRAAAIVVAYEAGWRRP